jgi:hypothetical protein
LASCRARSRNEASWFSCRKRNQERLSHDSAAIDRVRQFGELARKICRWAEDNGNRLTNADPDVPDSVFNRAADNWRPLLAVADAAGGDWPERARKAARAAAGDAEGEEAEARLAVLVDIKSVLVEHGAFKSPPTVTAIHSHDLVEALVEIEGTRCLHPVRPASENLG